jgi:signal transduction histidine kinase
MLICCGIIFIINMEYKGILLLAATSVFLYFQENRKKITFVVFLLLLYFIMDHSVLYEILKIYSINDYIQFYPSGVRLLLNVTRNLLNSLNEVLFIVFLFSVLQQEIDKSIMLQELYEKHYKNAEELRLANISLREYAIRSEKMAETRERNRLAREIHDTLGHVLTSISTGLEACMMIMVDEPAKLRQQLKLMLDAAREGLVDVRHSVKALRPDALERFKLKEALLKLTNSVQGVTNTTVTLAFDDELDVKLSADEEETIYRIVQECITNSVRHGESEHINVCLNKVYGTAIIEIKDNGNGCDIIVEGFGIRHMRERIELLGGTLEFCSGGGFRIKAEIPLRIRGDD